jgi:hypothetical protein
MLEIPVEEGDRDALDDLELRLLIGVGGRCPARGRVSRNFGREAMS